MLGDSLEGLSLFRRESAAMIQWMPPKDGQLWISSPGTYFWGRDTLPPRMSLAGAEARGRDSVAVRILVSDNVGILQTRVRGRNASDSLAWRPAPSGTILEFSLPAPENPAQPLEVRFSATDQSRAADYPPQGFLTLPRPLPSLAAPIALSAGIHWKMAGVPLAPGLSLTLRELAARSGTGPLFAAVWRDQAPPDSGYRILSGDDTLPEGRGFWIASEGNAPSLNFPPATAVASDSDGWFPIRLGKGWNLITSPAMRPLAWPVSLEDGEAYLRSPLKPLFAFDDTGYARPDSLRPWRSYYVYYDKDTVVRVGEGAPRVADRYPAKVSAAAFLRLELAAGDGIRLRLGASSAARAGLGLEDERQPPALAARSAAWLSREGRSLSVDYVAWDPDGAMAWTAILRRQSPGAVLSVPRSALPAGMEAWAVSPSRRLKWPLAPGSNIPVTGDDTLRIYAGRPAALARVPDLALGRPAAGAFAARLRPAAGGLELILELPTDAQVTARLLNARGQILDGLPNRTLAAGRHAFAWPSPDRPPLPQGLYWLDLRVQGQGWNHHKVCSSNLLH